MRSGCSPCWGGFLECCLFLRIPSRVVARFPGFGTLQVACFPESNVFAVERGYSFRVVTGFARFGASAKLAVGKREILVD